MIRELFKELRTRRESSTYQAILEEGREEGELHAPGEAFAEAAEIRLGSFNDEFRSRLQAIRDVASLRKLLRSAVLAKDWDELLDQV